MIKRWKKNWGILEQHRRKVENESHWVSVATDESTVVSDTAQF
jgi:hypothetical protein